MKLPIRLLLFKWSLGKDINLAGGIIITIFWNDVKNSQSRIFATQNNKFGVFLNEHGDCFAYYTEVK